jgi:WD40 repeat protein
VWQVADAVIDLQSHPHFANMNGGAAAAAATASAAAAGDLYLLEQPVHILYGHDDEVTCVACSSELDVVVSGSRDGTVMVHSLRTGRYTRTISPPEGGCIRWVGVSAQGIILTYSLLDLALHAYTINGVAIGSCDTAERLYALRFSADGQFLVAGGDRKQLSVYDLCAPGGAPQLCHRLPATDSTIRSIELTNEEQHVLVGTATGKLYVYGLNADFLRTRFLKRLAHLGL